MDVERVLADFGLSFATLSAPETRLTPDQGRALGRAILRAVPGHVDRCGFGLRAADHFMVRDADLLGYIVSHSAHPLDAARALAEHARLLGDSADFRVEIAGERVTLTLGLAGGKQMLPETSDFAAATVYQLLGAGSQGTVRPCEVRLPRPTPRKPGLYQRYFRAPVSFDAPASTLIYERTRMLQPLPRADSRLVEILEQHARARRQTLPQDALQDRVRELIALGLAADDYALARVAFRCGVGERTLRRRLTEAGTSYRALVDDVRQERALLLLEHAQSVSVVAQQLGFSDATAFARAFRRWTGVLPHEHLKAQPPAAS